MSDDIIRTSVRQLAGTHMSDTVRIALCNVESVDMGARACVCTFIDGKVANEITASLMASVDDGFLIIPTVGSTVKVVFSDYGQPFVCQYSEVETIIFRGGDLGGLVTVKSLTQKLNNIEQDLNSLKQALASWVPVPNDGGAALKLTLTNYTAAVLIETLQAEIENKMITHG